MNANGSLSIRNHNNIVIAPFLDSIQTGRIMNHRYVMDPCPDLLHQVTNLLDSRDNFDFSPTSIFIATWFEAQFGGRPDLVRIM